MKKHESPNPSSPEDEARALYGHILGARQKQHPFNYYLFQIAGARSSKSERSILMLRYTLGKEGMVKGARVSKYLTPEELMNEIATFNAVDLGKYTRIDEDAINDAASKLFAVILKSQSQKNN